MERIKTDLLIGDFGLGTREMRPPANSIFLNTGLRTTTKTLGKETPTTTFVTTTTYLYYYSHAYSFLFLFVTGDRKYNS